MKKVFEKWNSISLVLRILCGLIIGIILGLAVPKATVIIILGDLFVGALKAIAPLLVFFLVMSALAHMGEGQKTNMGFIVMLYMLGNLFSALVSVIACKLFPVTLTLAEAAGGDMAPPSGVGEVLKNLLLNVVSNPVGSIVNANYIGILAWACIFGIALKGASASTKKMLDDFSDAISTGVKWVISFAPFGIMGLIFNVIYTSGLKALLSYGRLILVLVGSMAFVAFIMNPIIVFLCIRKNPYPLVFKCLAKIRSSCSCVSEKTHTHLCSSVWQRVSLLHSLHVVLLLTSQLTWNFVKNLVWMKNSILSPFHLVQPSTWQALPSPSLLWHCPQLILLESM